MQEFRLTPEMRKALERAAEQLATANRLWGKRMRDTVATVLPVFEAASAQLRSQVAALAPALARAAAGFAEAWDRAIPPNWRGFEIEEILAVIDRVRETGYTLVWIPRAEIVREVLAANACDTADILLARREDVLDDAAACLQDVIDPQLALTREVIEQGITALRSGLPHVAQATASSALTSEISEFFGKGTTAMRKHMGEEDPEEANLDQIRIRTIFVAGAKALEEFWPNRDTPSRKDYNRHNTAHLITPEQWTEPNALSGIMLATALLREVEYWRIVQREYDREKAGGEQQDS